MTHPYLGIDIGFGDFKVVAGDNHEIHSLFKEPSAVAPVTISDHFSDSRAIRMGDHMYYVGNNALSMESSNQHAIDDYKQLAAFSPLILHTIFGKLGYSAECQPEHIVLGLSIAHINYSKNYRTIVMKYLEDIGFTDTQVKILPQGAGIKVAYDKYADTFPDTPTSFNAASNYLIADIGFNTIDCLYVIDGKVTPNQVKGIESMGLVVVARMLNEYIKGKFGKTDMTVKDLKKVLDDGFIKLRGKRTDLSEPISEMKSKYLKMVEATMESNYGKILDKVDYLLLAGGGSYFFQDSADRDEFYRVTKERSEYYNAIGYFLNARATAAK